MKKFYIKLLIILILFTSTACSKKEEDTSTLFLNSDSNHLNQVILLKMEEDKKIPEWIKLGNIDDYELVQIISGDIFIVIGDEFNIEDFLVLKDDNLTYQVNGIVDTNQEGIYEIDVVITDANGEETTIKKYVVVDSSEEINKKYEEIKEGTYISAKEVLEEENKKDTSNKKKSNQSNSSNTVNDEKASNIVNNSSYYGWGCEAIAGVYAGYNGNAILDATVYEVSSPQKGDLIVYFDANGNYKHTATYLENGMALHGNYSGGKSAIANANIFAQRKYVRLGSGKQYFQYIYDTAHSLGGNAGWIEGFFPEHIWGYVREEDSCGIREYEVCYGNGKHETHYRNERYTDKGCKKDPEPVCNWYHVLQQATCESDGYSYYQCDGDAYHGPHRKKEEILPKLDCAVTPEQPTEPPVEGGDVDNNIDE